MKKILIALTIILSLGITCYSQTLPQLGKAPLKSVIAAMTLEEKASMVVGMRTQRQAAPASANGPVTGQALDLVAGAAGTTYAIPRLGIPSIVVADGPAGLRIAPVRPNDQATYYCTAFPVGTLTASSWDVELAGKIGQAMGNEVLEYGVDVILGPGLNIHRNPLCGRNFEYFSEDPLITGKIASAMVKGIQSNGVGTSIKHFAGNNAETNRNNLNDIVSERALREIYLKGFGIAVHDAQPWTVMSSYNLINGFYASESYDLLTRVLRNDWSFKGFVMTDWGGGKDAVAQMKAGNDLLMPGNPNQSKTIVEAVSSGKLDASVLDKNVERILEIILQTPRFKGYKFSNKPDLKAHALIARQAASEGMVLLKNSDSALPLSADIKKIAAFGNTSYEIITGGTGSGDVNEAYSVALVEGLNNAGYSVDENLQSLYNAYLKAAKEGRQRGRGFMNGFVPVAEFAINSDIAGSMANVSDAALITIGRNSGEGSDRKAVEGDFLLSNEEKELIKQVTTAFHAKNKKVIVVLNIGGVIETASWRDLPDAILLAWQAGQETGNSIADILGGKVNPSGKLASTFPVNYSDVSSANNFPGKVITPSQATAGNQEVGQVNSSRRSQPSEITYEEGIYIGYRYYSTFKVPVSYEFGYGLSYTTFDYSNLKLSSPKFSSNFTVSIDIKNTGKVAGKEVAELYLSAPAGKLDKPESELKGFVKTRLLQPGESQVVTFNITPDALASFDTELSAWVAEAGNYTVKISASSKDIRQTASFQVGKDLSVKKESVALVPAIKIDELKP
jgi:Beta-glucosidase-related glycosidases